MISLPPECQRLLRVLCFGLLLPGFRAAADTPTPATAPAPADTNSFDAVTARLDRGGPFYLYLSAAQWLGHLSQQISEWRDLALQPDPSKTAADREKIKQGFDLASALVKKSGIEQLTGVGASSLWVGPGVYRNTLFFHHAKGQETGLLNTLFGSAPHALIGLDLLPADTAVASYGDCDIAGAIGAIRETVEQSGSPEIKEGLADALKQFALVSGMSADDFLQSLGGSSGIILTLDPAKPIDLAMGPGQKQTIPSPRLALLIEVKDDRIFRRAGQMLGMFPMVRRTDEPGLQMFTMGFPATPQFNLRATVAQWDKFLVLASDDQLVRDIIAAQKTGQGFKTTPAFAKLAAGLPVEGNGFSLMTQTFADALKRFQAGLAAQQPNTSPGQAALLQKMFTSQEPGAAYGVSAHVEDGWLNVSNAPRSLNNVVVPLMILPAAIAAGMALPIFHPPPPQDSRAVKSLAQAKQIGLACTLYAADHDGNFPPTLFALMPTYTDSRALFVSPFAPDAPLGYSYKTGLTTRSPADTVLVEDMFSVQHGQRVVVHVDNSGRITGTPAK